MSNLARRLNLGEQPLIGYARKSEEDKGAQVFSLPRQINQCEARVALRHKEGRLKQGKVLLWFKDSKSGRTFEGRDGFMAMLSWCREHPQPRQSPGYIILWEHSRFARPLIPGTKETDWDMYDKWRAEFALLGWVLYPFDDEPTGNPLVDRFTRSVKVDQGAKESVAIQERTSSGRYRAYKQGFWGNSRAPFGAVRMDAMTGQILRDLRREPGEGPAGEREIIQHGDRITQGRRVILGPNEEELTHWYHGARLILAGHPISAFQKYLTATIPSPTGKHWSHKVTKDILQNKALIGVIEREIPDDMMAPELGDAEILSRTPSARKGMKRYELRAKWEPIVDPDFFYRVQVAIKARENSGKAPRVSNRFPLTITCADCGLGYVGHSPKNRKPRYVHKKANRTPSELRRMEEAGCRHYAIPMDEIHDALRKLILEERGSANWAATMKKLYEASDEMENEAREAARFAQNRLDAAKRAHRNNLAALDECDDAESRALVLANLKKKKEEIVEAEQMLRIAEEQVRKARDSWADISEKLDETSKIDQAFAEGDLDAIAAIFNWWIDAIEVKVEYVPGKKQGLVPKRTLFVWLRTTPIEEPVVHEFDKPLLGRAVSLGKREEAMRFPVDGSSRITSLRKLYEEPYEIVLPPSVFGPKLYRKANITL